MIPPAPTSSACSRHLIQCGLAEEGSESCRQIVNSLWGLMMAVGYNIQEGTLELDSESGSGNRKGAQVEGWRLGCIWGLWTDYASSWTGQECSHLFPLSALLPICSVWLLSFSSHFCLLSAPEVACGFVSLASRGFHSLIQHAGQMKTSSDARRFPPRLSILSRPHFLSSGDP